MRPLSELDLDRLDTGRRTPEQAERLKRMIRLRLRGLTFKEIGDELGVSRQRVSQAIKKFQRSV